ncbi:MBL fold metallo-hydrolase [Bacteroidota bacterium]
MERKTFIYTFVLGAGSLLFQRKNLNAMHLNNDKTLIKMIYNNTGKCNGLINAGGLSVWIENEQGVTLFDAGGEASILEENAKQLGLDFRMVKQIIISHDHWDHSGGLSMVLEKSDNKPELYVTSNTEKQYAKDFADAHVIGVSEPLKIDEGIWSTGSFEADYNGSLFYEHSLIISRDDSMVLITGCSHPGIVKIAKRTMEIHPEKTLELICGGFHLLREEQDTVEEISKQLMSLGIKKIAPSHCTGDRSIEIFRKEWGKRFIDINIGDIFSA